MATPWRKNYLRYRELFLNILITYRKRQDVKMFLELLLSLATISLFAVFALKPTVVTIGQLIRDNRAKSETIQLMNTKIQNLETANQVYGANESKLPLIFSSIPENVSPDTLVKQIQGVANLNTVNILGINIGEVTLVGTEQAKSSSSEVKALPWGTNTLPFSITVTGNYESLLSFLKNLENLRRPLRIDTININSNQTENGKTIVMLISGVAPFLKPISQ